MNIGDKYLVVIPFFSGGAQGREIVYAVEGWRKHFKEPYHIAIVGDKPEGVRDGDDISFVPCERVGEVKSGIYRPHIDIINKFLKAHEVFPDTKGFIYVADDVYAVNNFDIHDIMTIKQNGDDLIILPDLNEGWNSEKGRTRDILSRNGYPTKNFTTHLPVWFDWDKLLAMIERFDMTHQSYIIETMYFNIYYPDRVPMQLNIYYDNLKCGVYRPNPRMYIIREAFEKKIWIQNSIQGWIPELDAMLSKYYNI